MKKMWRICHFLEMRTTGTETTSLVQLVTEYCELEKKAQSSFFALTEKAIDMFEHGLDDKQVGKEFRLAFAQANGMRSSLTPPSSKRLPGPRRSIGRLKRRSKLERSVMR